MVKLTQDDRLKTDISKTVETVELLSWFFIAHDLSRGLLK